MMKQGEYLKKIIDKASKALEILFLALTGFYVMYQILLISTFYLPFPEWFDRTLLRAMGAAAALRLIFLGPRRKEVYLSVAMIGLYFMIYRVGGYRFLEYLAVMTAGLACIDYRRILKTFAISAGAAYAVTIAAALTGGIDDLVYARVGVGFRSSLGLCYPTDLATLTLFLLMILWVVWERLPDHLMLPAAALFLVMALPVTHSDTCTICGALFILMVLYHWAYCRFINGQNRLKAVNSIVRLTAAAAYPLCATAVFGVMYLFKRGTGIGVRLNAILSDRLRLCTDALSEYGVNLFGARFDQIGNGFNTFTRTDYNFVDSTYPLILIRYGAVLFVILGVYWGWLAYRSAKTGQMRLALVMIVIAVHSIAEHHFMEPWYNILVAMPFAAYGFTDADAAEHSGQEAASRKIKAAPAAGMVLAGIVMAVLAPKIIPWIKTLYQAEHLNGGGDTGAAVIVIAAVLCAIIAAVLWLVYTVIDALTETHDRSRLIKAGCAAGTAVICAAALWLYGSSAVSSAMQDGSDVIETERKALEAVCAAAEEDIYTDVLPVVYHREFPAIKASALNGDEYARKTGATVIMDDDSERIVFFANGFIYARISDEHAIYTGDPAVIEALKTAGYKPAGYYSRERSLNLAEAGAQAGMEYSEESGLTLTGGEDLLSSGSVIDLSAGRYTLTVELNTLKEHQDGAPVCSIWAESVEGNPVIKKSTVMANQFDGEGRLQLQLKGTVDVGANGVRIYAAATNAEMVNVKSVSYKKTPEYDLHAVYNSKLRPVRKSYYSPDGTPIVFMGGYHSCEYVYDRKDNITEAVYYGVDGQRIAGDKGYSKVIRSYDGELVTEEHYYDADDRAVEIPAGYAGFSREYNNRGLMIKEWYYDSDGQLIRLQAGYCGFEQEYDNAGQLYVRRFLNAEGDPVLRDDGYSEIRWTNNPLTNCRYIDFYDLNGNRLDPVGINLITDSSAQMTAWIYPGIGVSNSTVTITNIYLPDKKPGDRYTVQAEIEFKDVSAMPGEQFSMVAQGSIDGQWLSGNVWNHELLDLKEPPEDGVYKYSFTAEIDDRNAAVSRFGIGIRCDGWQSGAFKIENIRISAE